MLDIEFSLWKIEPSILLHVTYLTSEAVGLVTHRALEGVYVVLKDAPAATVGRLAVEGVADLVLRLGHRLGQVLLIHFLSHQLNQT